ncbi:hypothetical protein CHS0354_013357, partial [Potamilus streckersoni]
MQIIYNIHCRFVECSFRGYTSDYVPGKFNDPSFQDLIVSKYFWHGDKKIIDYTRKTDEIIAAPNGGVST